MERRISPRHAVSLDAGYSYPNETSMHACSITDINRYGSRIELTTHQKLERGTRLQLHILLPDSAEAIIIMFHCAWSRINSTTDHGFEYEVGGFFYDISPENRNLLLGIADMPSSDKP